MSQRETILPVCKIVTVGVNCASGVLMANNAREIASIRFIGNADNIAVGTSSFTVSAEPEGAIDTATSATFNLEIVDAGSRTTMTGAGLPQSAPAHAAKINITEKGVYTGACNDFGVSAGYATVPTPADMSGLYLVQATTFEVIPTEPISKVPYVSVSPVSGGGTGWFRIFPSGTSDLYASATPFLLSLSDAGDQKNQVVVGAQGQEVSGSPGVIGGDGDTLVLTLQPSMAVDQIGIENQLNASAVFAVNYGVIHQANPVRDQETPDSR